MKAVGEKPLPAALGGSCVLHARNSKRALPIRNRVGHRRL
jgi:hypothetical protein